MSGSIKHLFILAAFSLLVIGCGHTGAAYQPIVDGPKDEKYHSDLQACRQLAEQRSYLNDDVVSDALISAGIGAVAGGIWDGWGGAGVGALAGGAIGAGEGAWENRYDRRDIVCTCMKQRGHNVVEALNSHGRY